MRSSSLNIFCVLLIILGISSCSNSDNNSVFKQENEKLKRSNDSLTRLLDTLKTKYIFDKTFVKHIPSENKDYKKGDAYTGEFYFVAYNDEDRVLFSDGKGGFKNADTLSIKKGSMGAYTYTTTVKSDTMHFLFKPIIKNHFALQFANQGYQTVTISDKKLIR